MAVGFIIVHAAVRAARVGRRAVLRGAGVKAADAADPAISSQAMAVKLMLRFGKMLTTNDVEAIQRKNLDVAYYLPTPRFDVCRHEWVSTGVGERDAEIVYLRDAPGGFGGAERPVILFLHGGGFFSGVSRMYAYFLGSVAERLKADVLAPNYRLAPAHKWPTQLDDCVLAYRWLVRERGIPASRIFLLGDSAGGGLCAHIMASIAQGRLGLPMPRAAILISPFLDVSFQYSSFHTHRHRDPFLKVDETLAHELIHSILGVPAGRARDPEVMPAAGALSGPGGTLCPLLVFIGSEEVLIDDVRVFAARAEAAGVDVDLHVADGLYHVYPVLYPRLPEAAEALEQMAAFVRKRLPLALPPEAIGAPEPQPQPPLVVELDEAGVAAGA